MMTCVFYDGAASLSFSLLYDRYLLALLPLAVALIWLGQLTRDEKILEMTFRLRSMGVATGLVSLVLAPTFATAATHDYLDWNRVRWNTDLSLIKEGGVADTDLDGGWEYNNYVANLCVCTRVPRSVSY